MSRNVSSISLISVAENEPVDAELYDSITEDELLDWQASWLPSLAEGMQKLNQKGVLRANWPQSAHWNWRDKASRIEGLLACPAFCIKRQGMTQGLMQLNLIKSARIPQQEGRPIVCIDYIENAPWNRPELHNPPKFRGVGSIFVRAAIELSYAEEWNGRIGLHSLPQANNFYSSHCGMTDFGKDADYENLRYFEMSPDQARAFVMEGSRHEHL